MKKKQNELARVIADLFRCYAGILHLRHGSDDGKPNKITNRGFSRKFEITQEFPGRMAAVAKSRDLTGTTRSDSPALDGLPRLIFISDMGDALSKSISFEYLRNEIIEIVASENGQRHIWLWLTKRPRRMAEFSDWLTAHDIAWPDNLVAMTSVTSRKTLNRIDHLRMVNCRFRGLSIEPLWEKVNPDLTGIDWAIVGGESGGGALPFDLEWARSLQQQCWDANVAFFVKQLGTRPIDNGREATLTDAHGGDWDEWPSDLKSREFPTDWFRLETANNQKALTEAICKKRKPCI